MTIKPYKELTHKQQNWPTVKAIDFGKIYCNPADKQYARDLLEAVAKNQNKVGQINFESEGQKYTIVVI